MNFLVSVCQMAADWLKAEWIAASFYRAGCVVVCWTPADVARTDSITEDEEKNCVLIKVSVSIVVIWKHKLRLLD